MTMLSFRVEDNDATAAQRWADELGIDKSEPIPNATTELDRLDSLANAGATPPFA